MTTINISIGGNHGAVRLDKVNAIRHGNLASIVHSANLDNGSVVQLGDLATGNREAFNVLVPTASSINSDALWLHASSELNYYAGQTITDFFLAQGELGRAYLLSVGDIVTITNNMITGGTPVVDDWLAPVAGQVQLGVVGKANAEPTTRFVAKVIEASTSIFGQTATAFVVLKN